MIYGVRERKTAHGVPGRFFTCKQERDYGQTVAPAAGTEAGTPEKPVLSTQ